MSVDLTLTPGTLVRSSIRDEKGTLIGNGIVMLYSTIDGETSQQTLLVGATGTTLGQFAADSSALTVEIECRAPGFIWTKRAKLDIAPKSKETVVDFALRPYAGVVVRGPIVDTSGKPLDLLSLVAARLPAIHPRLRPYKFKVFAVPSEDLTSPSSTDGSTRQRKPVEGRVDYVAGQYEVVLDNDFRGSLELRILKAVVGSAPLPDLNHPPELPCDDRKIPESAPTTTYAIRYIDAESRLPIDLSQEVAPPLGNDGSSVAARPRAESDLHRGFVVYDCAPGFLQIDVAISGHAAGKYFFEVPATPSLEPHIVEVPRAEGGVRGIVVTLMAALLGSHQSLPQRP
jgi:hypothetical protein